MCPLGCRAQSPLFPSLFLVPLSAARPNSKSTMMECNHARCPAVTYLISVTGDKDDHDHSLSGVDSHHESFMLGMGEHAGMVFVSNKVTSMMGQQTTASSSSSSLCLSDDPWCREGCFLLLVHQNSNKICWQGAHRAVFSLLPPWLFTGHFHRSILLSAFRTLLWKLLSGKMQLNCLNDKCLDRGGDPIVCHFRSNEV
jgi:hypothetical protein